MDIQFIMFCEDCGFIAEPNAAMINQCPDCKRTLCTANGETAVVLNMIRLRTIKGE